LVLFPCCLVLDSVILVDAGELPAGRRRLPPRAAAWKATRHRLTAYTRPPPLDLEPTAQINPSRPKEDHTGQLVLRRQFF
jgi:hypothetical protein